MGVLYRGIAQLLLDTGVNQLNIVQVSIAIQKQNPINPPSSDSNQGLIHLHKYNNNVEGITWGNYD